MLAEYLSTAASPWVNQPIHFAPHQALAGDALLGKSHPRQRQVWQFVATAPLSCFPSLHRHLAGHAFDLSQVALEQTAGGFADLPVLPGLQSGDSLHAAIRCALTDFADGAWAKQAELIFRLPFDFHAETAVEFIVKLAAPPKLVPV